jgi:tetratricopeptide (TPR) repeat protein
VLPGALAREHVDEEWLFSVSLLPDVCVFLGDEDAAAELYALLLPYEALYAMAPSEASFGSVARGLGVLATQLGRFDDAERHLTAALELERRMGARPWIAHVLHDHASMLLARRGAGDAEAAQQLLDEAVAAYRDLGMEAWAARGAALAGGPVT